MADQIEKAKSPTARLAKQPLRFEVNQGQTGAPIRFMSRGPGYSLFLSPREAVVALAGNSSAGAATEDVVRIRLLGGHPEPKMSGTEPLPGVTNYLMGADPTRWVTNVPGYAGVRYEGVYPGVDAVYYGDEKGRLEYDFLVSPGADPSSIRLSFAGGGRVRLESNGELTVRTPGGELRQHKPVVYQDTAAGRKKVSGRYVVRGDGSEVGFEIGRYDRTLPLVIDPVLVYSTYLGGEGVEEGRAIDVDANGFTYVTGATTSADFPTKNPLDGGCGTDRGCNRTANSLNPNDTSYTLKSDVFVTKLTPAGDQLVYSTYVGGSGSDIGFGIGVDAHGNAYVTGMTASPDFPVTTSTAFDGTCGSDGKCDLRASDVDDARGYVKTDAFLLKLNALGAGPEYSTYLGGRGDDTRPEPALYQLAAELPPGDEIGGVEPEPDDVIQTVPQPGDPFGNRLPPSGGIAIIGETAYVASSTLSPDFPTTANAADKDCGTGTEDCNKFYCNHEQGCPPPSGNAQNKPPQGMIKYFPDAFLTAIDTTKAKEASLVYSSFFGGSGSDSAHGVALTTVSNGTGQESVRALIVGQAGLAQQADQSVPNPLSIAPDPMPYPTTSGAFKTTTREGFGTEESNDAFVTAVEPARSAGTLVWSSLLGGHIGRDIAYGVVVSSDGSPYVVGESAAVDKTNTPALDERFPTTAGAFQAVHSSPDNSTGVATADAFVTKFRADGTSLLYSTFLGGLGLDVARSIAVDGSGDAYITGSTTSTDFDTVGSLQTLDQPDGTAFVAKIRPIGSGQADLVYSTLLGGRFPDPSTSSTNDEGRSIAVLGEAAFVTGTTSTSDFPREAAVQPEHGGLSDAFVAQLATSVSSPQITGIEPREGISSGGTEVSIIGTGFAAMTSVSFGGTSTAPVGTRSDTLLTVKTPPGRGVVDVSVVGPGGNSAAASVAKFSYYDGSWTDAEPHLLKRAGHTATLVSRNCGAHCGSVLVVGGSTGSSIESVGTGDPTAKSAVIFDPSGAERWTTVSCAVGPGGPSACPDRYRHSATELKDGSVLIVGGGGAPQSAQIYRPQEGTWEDAGTTVFPRQGHAATLLPDGRVLIVGGWFTGSAQDNAAHASARTAELYDPEKPLAERWSLTAPPRDERVWLHTATLLTGGSETGTNCLTCGKVLVLGGANKADGDPVASPSAELYDPVSELWTDRLSVLGRYSHTATTLTSGKVLIAGGITEVEPPTALGSDPSVGRALSASDIFDPSKPFAEAFTPAGALLTARSGHAAVALPDGRAVVVGGAAGLQQTAFETIRSPLASTEVYDPVQGRWFLGDAMRTPRGDGTWPAGHSATLLGKAVLVFGGLTRAQEGPAGDPSCADGVDNDEDSYIDGEDDNCEPTGGVGLRRVALKSAESFTPGPYVSSIDPSTGPADGRTWVTIRGSGFVADRMEDPASVMFGRVPAVEFHVDSAEEVTALSPVAAEADVVDVNVVVQDSGLATGPTPFTYTGLPGRILDLAAALVSVSEAELTFSAPGTVGNVGAPAQKYVIKQSRSAITAENFDEAVSLCDGGACAFSPTRVGLTLRLSVKGLVPETTYYYAVRAMNSSGGVGPMSNVAQLATGTVLPDGVRDLVAAPVDENTVQLTFSAPGSNGVDPPPASRFVIKQSLAPITDDAFDSALSLCDSGACHLSSQSIGDRLNLSVGNLRKDTTYHYRLRAVDDAGNLGPLSNTATVTPACSATTSSPGGVLYSAGYSLIGLPEGAVVPSRTPLFGWFNLGAGGRYSSHDPAGAVVGGRGYWAWFSCPRVVNLPSVGQVSTSSPLGAYRASMVGNPSATSQATVSGHDFAARWDPGLNGGSGGYRMSAYQQAQQLAVGEGMWAFSYRDTTLQVSAP